MAFGVYNNDGSYRVTPVFSGTEVTTANPLPVAMSTADIEIGAVEIKNGTSDQRATVNTDGSLLTRSPDSLAVSGSVTSATVIFSQDLTGYEAISVQLTSIGSGNTIISECSDDNSTWVACSGANTSNIGNGPWSTSFSQQAYVFPKRARYFRFRVSAYSSGTITVVGNCHKSCPTIPWFPSSVVIVATGTTGTDRSITASTTSQQLMAANANRKGFYIQNDSTIDVWINPGATAVASAGSGNIKISGTGGSYVTTGMFFTTAAINIIAASGTPAITAREF